MVVERNVVGRRIVGGVQIVLIFSQYKLQGLEECQVGSISKGGRAARLRDET